jgi:hypothetical protein
MDLLLEALQFRNSIEMEDTRKLAFFHIQEQVLQFYNFVAVTE